MAAELSWHVWTCVPIRSLIFNSEQHEILQDLGYELINACKMFVELRCILSHIAHYASLNSGCGAYKTAFN